ncbi:hypothetical protein [Citrobacter farmeri]|uniref:hypothetical protein n=1 Tax=Citrobacter farmeri TaxID=67824 RepID=UPI003607450D
MTTITRERLQEVIDGDILFTDEQRELARIALASLTAEPALYAAEETLAYAKHGELHLTCLSEPMGDAVIPLYATPPAPVVPTFDEWLEIRGNKPLGWVKDAMRESYDACRAAMLQGADGNSPAQSGFRPVQNCIPPAQCGNSPVIPGEVLSAVRKVACIRADFDGFDGDRRDIGDCLDEAEQELIVTINKYASVIAAAPQEEVK